MGGLHSGTHLSDDSMTNQSRGRALSELEPATGETTVVE